MFTDAVKYQSKTVSTQVQACVFPVADIDAMADFDSASDIRQCIVNIESSSFKNCKPLIGDKITLEDGSRYGVAKIDLANGIYSLTSREISNAD